MSTLQVVELFGGAATPLNLLVGTCSIAAHLRHIWLLPADFLRRPASTSRWLGARLQLRSLGQPEARVSPDFVAISTLCMKCNASGEGVATP